MNITQTPFKGLLIIEPKVFSDQRGSFLESWNKKTFAQAGIYEEFVQDNLSASSAGVIRGLHFQVPPNAQGKLVSVLRGSVVDIAVDLRRNEPTYGQHYRLNLLAGEHKMLFIPPGFAHGFRSLEDNTLFFYKCTGLYHQGSERSIRWNDPQLAIDWGTNDGVISDKDLSAPLFSEFDSPF